MNTSRPESIRTLAIDSLWEQTFTVSPLIVVGSVEPDGRYDLAPKHLATRLSWDNHYGFICTPDHSTYHNIRRSGVFTVTFPQPNQMLLASLAAGPRCADDSKPALDGLRTFPAEQIDGVFLADGYLFLECTLDRIIDGFGNNSLIAGEVVAAHAAATAIVEDEAAINEMLAQNPLLAYLDWGHFARIDKSYPFPFLSTFKR